MKYILKHTLNLLLFTFFLLFFSCRKEVLEKPITEIHYYDLIDSVYFGHIPYLNNSKFDTVTFCNLAGDTFSFQKIKVDTINSIENEFDKEFSINYFFHKQKCIIYYRSIKGNETFKVEALPNKELSIQFLSKEFKFYARKNYPPSKPDEYYSFKELYFGGQLFYDVSKSNVRNINDEIMYTYYLNKEYCLVAIFDRITSKTVYIVQK
jgi:hypothetical protein